MTLQSESDIQAITSDHFRRHPRFLPTDEDIAQFGRYELVGPRILPKPDDIMANEIAYNPAGINTLPPNSADNPTGSPIEITVLRVEPNRVDSGTSHLGKSVVRAYMVDLIHATTPQPFYNAMEFLGEDPSLIRIRRRLPISGRIENAWLHSSVHVTPKANKPYEVASLQTVFRAGTSLNQLEIIAKGPPGMKDVRLAMDEDPDSTKLHGWTRPQPRIRTGNIGYTTIPDLSKLSEETLADAPLIDKDLFPDDSDTWGGVGDIFSVGNGRFVLASHQAWMTGPDNRVPHYEAVMFGHNTVNNRIVDLGAVATASMFPGHNVKDDTNVDLHDVVFTGGGRNGKPELLTFGVGDGSIGIGRLRRLS